MTEEERAALLNLVTVSQASKDPRYPGNSSLLKCKPLSRVRSLTTQVLLFPRLKSSQVNYTFTLITLININYKAVAIY